MDKISFFDGSSDLEVMKALGPEVTFVLYYKVYRKSISQHGFLQKMDTTTGAESSFHFGAYMCFNIGHLTLYNVRLPLYLLFVEDLRHEDIPQTIIQVYTEVCRANLGVSPDIFWHMRSH